MIQNSKEVVFRAQAYPDFIVDRQHGVLLNTNRSKLESYKRERKRLQEIALNNNRLAKLENDVGEIKQLLKDLVNGRQL